ncbi:MAG: hypothetical protein CM15mP13_2330 [Pseudomonadota bacterium]|nr:MAG: hypothetical protein CM15mP13_2330 [Pseudomonadota bacterium]
MIFGNLSQHIKMVFLLEELDLKINNSIFWEKEMLFQIFPKKIIFGALNK